MIKSLSAVARCAGSTRCLALIGAVAILLFCASVANWSSEYLVSRSEFFLRLAILIALVTGGMEIIFHIWRSAFVLKTDWWNIGGKLDDPTWEDVRLMTIGNQEDDPVVYRPLLRPVATATRSIAAYVVLGCLLIEAISAVVAGPVLPRLLADHAVPASHIPGGNSVNLELSANLTAFLALIAAAVSIYFTHRQLQAKVKADSRQAWIDKLRAHIARFIALVDLLYEADEGRDVANEKKELTTCRLEMELMLNPSEKDHRMLMYLSLRLAFFDWGEADFALVHDVRNLRHAIRSHSSDMDETAWAPLMGPIPAKSSPQHQSEFSDLVGYAMRLAHVVLKREWERVKSTR